jgi:hypothetical protein
MANGVQYATEPPPPAPSGTPTPEDLSIRTPHLAAFTPQLPPAQPQASTHGSGLLEEHQVPKTWQSAPRI